MMHRFERIFKAVPHWLRLAGQGAFCMLLGGGVSLALGRDVSATPFVQTLYSAYAFVSGRMGVDLFAAGEGPVINPLLYIPHYLIFVKLNNFPHLSVFLEGMAYGLFVFAVWKACALLFERESPLLALVCTMLAVTGLAALANVGLGNGALWLAVLAVWAFVLLFHLEKPQQWKWGFFIAAFAAGLHFSAFPALAGLLVAAWVLHRGAEKNGHMLGCFLFAFGGFVLAVSAGVWYAWLTGTLDSFGGFFWPEGWALGPSPWAPEWEFPAGWQEWVFLPFWRWRYALAGYVVDVRLACGLICALVLLGKYFFSPREPSSRTESALSAFFLTAYLGWLLGWRTAEASIVLEFAGVLLLGKCLVWLAGTKGAALGAVVLLWVLFPLRTPADRQGIEEHNFAFFKEPVLAEHSLVLMAGHMSGLIPFLPQHSRYVGGIWFDPQDYSPASEFFLQRLNSLPSGYYSHRKDAAIRAAVQAHQGALYALVPQEKAADRPAVWQRYGMKFKAAPDTCQALNWAEATGGEELLLCPAEKIAPPK